VAVHIDPPKLRRDSNLSQYEPHQYHDRLIRSNGRGSPGQALLGLALFFCVPVFLELIGLLPIVLVKVLIFIDAPEA